MPIFEAAVPLEKIQQWHEDMREQVRTGRAYAFWMSGVHDGPVYFGALYVRYNADRGIYIVGDGDDRVEVSESRLVRLEDLRRIHAQLERRTRARWN